jgi:hypothetical protein
VDGVGAFSSSAGVTLDRAAGSGRGLSRGIRDLVALAGAAALEGVVETNPVTDLVSESLADYNECQLCSKVGMAASNSRS